MSAKRLAEMCPQLGRVSSLAAALGCGCDGIVGGFRRAPPLDFHGGRFASFRGEPRPTSSATPMLAANPSSLVGSPRHDGGKRRHPGVAYRSSCGPVSASSTVAGSHGASASLSTPVHFPKCARADGRGVSHQPGDDRRGECGGNSGARVGCPSTPGRPAGPRSSCATRPTRR